MTNALRELCSVHQTLIAKFPVVSINMALAPIPIPAYNNPLARSTKTIYEV